VSPSLLDPSRFADAPPQARAKLAELVSPSFACPGPSGIPWVPHIPHPKQQAFLLLATREALFGGAAGGGKTDALLMAALQYVCIPGYAAVMFRQNYPQLAREEGLIDRANEWLAPTDATYSATDRVWHFPSGATLTLAHLERDDDRHKWAGPAFQRICWDELTNWASERPYRFLFSRLRRRQDDLRACPTCGRTIADVPLSVRAGTNPGGPGQEWVYRRFVLPWERWRKGEGPRPERVFLPSRLRDNPSLDYDAYVESLEQLDGVELAQLLEGDWSVREAGDYFDRTWFPIVHEAPAGLRLVRHWDLAATEAKGRSDPDWTVGALVGLSSEGRWFVLDLRRVRATPGKVEALVAQTAALDGRAVPVHMEQEPGSSGVNTIDHYRRRVLVGHTFTGSPTTGSKSVRARPLSAAAEAGNVILVDTGSWDVEAFLAEAELFPLGAHDDQVDAVAGAMEYLAGKRGRGGLRA
jgi:predicted phage terminase large subunit-like protein